MHEVIFSSFFIYRFFCIPITFDNSIKACFTNKKYIVSTLETTYSLLKNWVQLDLQRWLVLKSITYQFWYKCNKILKLNNYPYKLKKKCYLQQLVTQPKGIKNSLSLNFCLKFTPFLNNLRSQQERNTKSSTI